MAKNKTKRIMIWNFPISLLIQSKLYIFLFETMFISNQIVSKVIKMKGYEFII